MDGKGLWYSQQVPSPAQANSSFPFDRRWKKMQSCAALMKYNTTCADQRREQTSDSARLVIDLMERRAPEGTTSQWDGRTLC